MIRLLAAASIFLSAFLVFQVQPILARLVLPWYGGSAAVWGTCILFFQTVLFLGYAYAHQLAALGDKRRQAGLHVTLLVVSLLLLPMAPGGAWKPSAGTDPALGILSLLTACVGLPYFLLSSTSPLAQAWLLRGDPRSLPYRFYALSNLASLGALLAYPALEERTLPLSLQTTLWSCGYALFALVCGVLAVTSAVQPDVATAGESAAERTGRAGWARKATWLLLGALPSALSLAVTSHLTQNVASIPLLWVLPLGIYLLTLILTFDADAWYRPSVFVPANVVTMAAGGYLLVDTGLRTDLRLQLAVFSLLLFTASMSLHGELVRRRPEGRELTGFYLWMALGGALGGISVGLGAPYLLRGYFELPIALSACCLALLLLEFRRSLMTDAVLALLAAWAMVTSAVYIRSVEAEAVVIARNFYGGCRVIDVGETASVPAHRDLVHGSIVHGSQILNAARRREPTAYYARGTGIEFALDGFRGPGARVGVVGLGTGTMAAYGRAGETWRYYELNPMVVEIARRQFTYLDDSPADIRVVLGDGRLSLEREDPQGFSVLAVDAFSGDAIPVHLLSREAFELYFRHLRSGGVLAVHVSNDVIDLGAVVAAAASAVGKSVLQFVAEPDAAKLRGDSRWLLVADDAEFAARPALLAAGTRVNPDPAFRTWTDDYSNLLGVLR